MEVLFPKVRAKVFELLFGADQREHYVRELAWRGQLTLHTIQDELRKLTALGLVISRSNGFRRYYQANRSHALYPAICQIVSLSSQMPSAHLSDLRRVPGKRSAKLKRRRPAHLRVSSGPLNWGIFERKS